MFETITVQELGERLVDEEILLVDVREAHEYAAGHVPGALSIPMSVLPVRVHELPKGRPVHIICQSGGRSMQVSIWLEKQGYTPVNVDGGTGTWVRAGGPILLPSAA
jgi:rhodanese-related sulfurtransferase